MREERRGGQKSVGSEDRDRVSEKSSKIVPSAPFSSMFTPPLENAHNRSAPTPTCTADLRREAENGVSLLGFRKF